MNQSATQRILITPPDQIRAASAYGLPLAHMAYRIGSGPHLFRANLPVSPRGGLMLIGDGEINSDGDAMGFCREVMRECLSRGFSGIVIDLEQKPTPLLAHIISHLENMTTQRGLSFYLPEAYSAYGSRAKIMVSSALSGGTLARRLQDAQARYGDRVVLCVQRSAEDFFLPASQGFGRSLTREQLQQKMAQLAPSVFFSHELCAHYFTYMARDSGAHFVLFDDVGSIHKKISFAEELGIREVFLSYAELDDLLPTLLASSRRPHP